MNENKEGNSSKHIKTKLSRFITTHKREIMLTSITSTISLIVGITIAAVMLPIGDWWEGGKGSKPYLAVVMSKSEDFTIPQEFTRGFQAAAGGASSIEDRSGLKVEIRYPPNYGSIEEAKRLARKLVNDDNCLLVIGNSDSTTTEETLNIFLESENPPALIMPIATANNLTEKARGNNAHTVLRLVPNNSKQAVAVQQLITNRMNKKFVAIYADEENPKYSKDLSREIASRIRKSGGVVLVEESIGPSRSIYSSLDAWSTQPQTINQSNFQLKNLTYPIGNKEERHMSESIQLSLINGIHKNRRPYLKNLPQVIVYVGVAHHALLLIDQLRELSIDVPVIFTDGCMVEVLIKSTIRMPNKAFVLSPVAYSSAGVKPLPTYESIGQDAFQITKNLLSSCEECTREKLRDIINNKKRTGEVLISGNAGEYQFDQNGESVRIEYKAYDITGGKINSESRGVQ